MTLDAYRALFDLPPDLAYLDHAAAGVLSRPTHDAALGALGRHAGHVPGASPNTFPADLERLDRLRTRAATLLNADVRGVEVVPNTSAGINWLAQGLDWKAGDRVAIPACEFPTNHLPWRALAARGVIVDRVGSPGGTVTPEAIDAAITDRTRVVSVSFVQFLSGFRADLRRHRRGVPRARRAVLRRRDPGRRRAAPRRPGAPAGPRRRRRAQVALRDARAGRRLCVGSADGAPSRPSAAGSTGPSTGTTSTPSRTTCTPTRRASGRARCPSLRSTLSTPRSARCWT